MTEETPGPGHNLPPAYDQMKPRTDELVISANKSLAAYSKDGIPDEEVAAQFSDFKDQLNAQRKAVDAARADERKVHADAAAAVQKKWKPDLALIDKCLEHVKAMLAPWLNKKEDERKAIEAEAREQADSKRREAEEAEKAAQKALVSGGDVVGSQVAAEQAAKDVKAAERIVKKAAKPVGIKGRSAGRATSARTKWKWRITDQNRIPLDYWSPDEKKIDAKVAKHKGDTKIPGIEVYEKKTVV